MPEEARRTGDRKQEAAMLADLGVMARKQGDAAAAIPRFQEALVIARQLGDRQAETDILGNLGLAALALRDAAGAQRYFDEELVNAQTIADRFAEKTALEHKGRLYASLRNAVRAIEFFEQALELTRTVGDQHQEAELLWRMAIQFAELGDRDRAIANAQATVDLMNKTGNPEALAYAEHLERYRPSDLYDRLEAPNEGWGAVPSQSALPVSIGMTALTQQTRAASKRSAGPGLLRMAFSAAKSMGRFLGSGLKTTPAGVRQKRIAACAQCRHHTGLRCRVCGCFTDLKSRMQHEDCPIGNWPA